MQHSFVSFKKIEIKCSSHQEHGMFCLPRLKKMSRICITSQLQDPDKRRPCGMQVANSVDKNTLFKTKL